MATFYEGLRTAGQITPEEQYALDPETQFAKGLRTGAAGITAGALANEALNAELRGEQEFMEKQARAAQVMQEAQMYAPRVRSLRDVGSVGEFGDFAAGAVGQGVMSMAPSIAGALLMRGRGNGLLSKAGTFAGAAIPSYQMERGEAALNQYEDPVQMQAPVEDRALAASVKGGVNAALESIVPAGVGGALFRKPTGTFLGNLGRDALTEGATEAAQQAVGYGAQKYIDPTKELDPWDVVDAFAAGGLTGGAVSAAGRMGTHAAAAGANAAYGAASDLGSRAKERAVNAKDAAVEVALDAKDSIVGKVGDFGAAIRDKYGDGVIDKAIKTKDFVSGHIDRMTDALKESTNPIDFVNRVFSRRAEEDAAEDIALNPDGSLRGSTFEETAENISKDEAKRTERAKFYADELLNDPATTPYTRERVAAMGGDYSDKANRDFLARTLVAQRSGEKLVEAARSIVDLGKDMMSSAKDSAKGIGGAIVDRIVKKNMQGGTEHEKAAKTVYYGLTDTAKNDPKIRAQIGSIARSLVSFANRTGDITPEDLPRLAKLSSALSIFKDPDSVVKEILGHVGGADTEDSFLMQARKVTTAQRDVKRRDSFFMASIPEEIRDNLSTPQIRKIARLVDEFTAIDGANSKRGSEVVKGLANVFGSTESALGVLDFYAKENRADIRYAPSETMTDADSVADSDEDMSDTGGSESDFSLTETDAPKSSYQFKDAKSLRPYSVLRSAGGRGAKESSRAALTFSDNAEVRQVPYSEYVAATGADPEREVKRIAEDIKKRIAGHKARKNEDRSQAIAELEGELTAMREMYRTGGAKAALDLFEVLEVNAAEQDDTKASDEDLAAYSVLTKDPGATDTRITFEKTDGSKLMLSAESMWKAQGDKEGSGSGENPGRRMKRLFSDAVAAVLNRPDIKRVITDVNSVVLDRKTQQVLKPSRDPAYKRAVDSALQSASSDLGRVSKRLDDVKAEFEELLSEDGDEAEYRREDIQSVLQQNIDRAQQRVDELRRMNAPVAVLAVARERLRMYKDTAAEVGALEFESEREKADANREGMPTNKKSGIRSRDEWDTSTKERYAEEDTGKAVGSTRGPTTGVGPAVNSRAVARAVNDPHALSTSAITALHNIIIGEGYDKLNTLDKVYRFAAAVRKAEKQISAKTVGMRSNEERELLPVLKHMLKPDTPYDWDVLVSKEGKAKAEEARNTLDMILHGEVGRMGAPKTVGSHEYPLKVEVGTDQTSEIGDLSRLNPELRRLYKPTDNIGLLIEREDSTAFTPNGKHGLKIGTFFSIPGVDGTYQVTDLVEFDPKSNEDLEYLSELTGVVEDEARKKVRASTDSIVVFERVKEPKPLGAVKIPSSHVKTRSERLGTGASLATAGKPRTTAPQPNVRNLNSRELQIQIDGEGGGKRVTASVVGAVPEKGSVVSVDGRLYTVVEVGKGAMKPRSGQTKEVRDTSDVPSWVPDWVSAKISPGDSASFDESTGLVTIRKPGGTSGDERSTQVVLMERSPVSSNGSSSGIGENHHELPMYYKIGNVARLRKELRSKYTSNDFIAALIPNGDRTATTRRPPAGVSVGDVVTFPGVEGKYRVTGFDKVDLKSEAGREKWSKREGWSVEAANSFGGQVRDGATQMVFERIPDDGGVKKTEQRVVLPNTSPYSAKDQHKADRSNKFIGRGSERSSTNAYALAYKDKANSGNYEPSDTVFVSAEGARSGRLDPDFEELRAAAKAGVTFYTDNYVNRNRPYNVGERQVAEFLKKQGYTETAETTAPISRWERTPGGGVKKNSFIGQQGDEGDEGEHDVSEQEIRDEIARIRGKDVAVEFAKFVDLKASGEFTMNKDKTARLIKIAMDSVDPMSTAWHESMHDFMAMLGTSKEERKLKSDLLETANAPHVMAVLRILLADHPEALKQIESDQDERLAYVYQFWALGVLRLGWFGDGVFGKVVRFIQGILGIVSKDQRTVELLEALHEGKFSEPSIVAAVMHDMKAKTLGDKLSAISKPISELSEKIFTSATDRMRNTNIPALTEVADMFHREPGREKGGLPFMQRRAQNVGKYLNRLQGLLEDSTNEERRRAIDNMQAMKAPSSPLEHDLAEYLRDLHTYMVGKGVKRLDSKSGKWVDIGDVKNYFPRVWDKNAIRNDEPEFIALLSKYVGLNQARETFKAITNGDGSLELAENEHSLGFTPWNPAVLDRQFTFITKANAAQFSKYQSKDMADIMTSYTQRAVHRAEYAEMFGNDGEVLKEKFEEALDQGATEEELEMAKKAIMSLEGTLGHEFNPRAKEVMSGIMTYQNIVLLPLSLFSNLVDPIGIALRSNSMVEAWRAFTYGMKGLAGQILRMGDDAQTEMAKTLGLIDDQNMLDAMGHVYNSMHMSKTLKTVNRKFFRYNGMEMWNQRMRVAAMMAAQRFILSNLDNDRYMRELGITEKDVYQLDDGTIALTQDQLTQAGAPAGDAADIEKRIQEAVFKWVDGAVLRPSAAHRPIWGSDPRYMLIFHLKQFTFSFQNTILRRMSEELRHGNMYPAIILASYVPFMFLSDVMKGSLTGTIDATTSMYDVAMRSVQRSGVLGTGVFGADAWEDIERGKLPGTSFLGPAFGHLTTLLKGLGGHAGLEQVIDRSVPLVKHL